MNWASLIKPILGFLTKLGGFLLIRKSGKDAVKLDNAKDENELRKDYADIDNKPDSDDPAGDL